MKRVSVLGSTGSIGRSTVDVLRHSGEEINVEALTAYGNVGLLAEQARMLDAGAAVIGDPSLYEELKQLLEGTDTKVLCGREGIMEAAAIPADWTMAAIVGMAGLEPLMVSLGHGANVAVANKEPLVAAGRIVMAEVERAGACLIPVDSEHNAIFQVFEDKNRAAIDRIILTASGGPFRTWSLEEMESATPAQAVAHPNWSMGAKISVDSASMMNKALEIIEAHHLFDMPADRIKVLVHPESIVHSMVEYGDGSVLAQLGAPDMRTPISHALAWPGRMETPGKKLDIDALSSLTFDPPDAVRFPAIRLACQALADGPCTCVALNAANEVAVEFFLSGMIKFTRIAGIVEDIMHKVEPLPLNSLEDVIRLDKQVRKMTKSLISDNA